MLTTKSLRPIGVWIFRYCLLTFVLWFLVVGPSCYRARRAGSDWPEFLPNARFHFLDRLTSAPGKPIATVLKEMAGYTVWEGAAQLSPPPGVRRSSFPANFTGTLSFANDHDSPSDYVVGYYCIFFTNGIATGVYIFDD